MQEILLGIFLGGCAWTDGWRKEISLCWLGLWLLVGGIGIVSFGSLEEFAAKAGGVSIGAFLLAAAVLSRGQIGFGDGLVFLVCGLFLDFWENSFLLLGGLLLLLGRFAAEFFYRKIKRNTQKLEEQPLMPYVFAAYIGGLLWNL